VWTDNEKNTSRTRSTHANYTTAGCPYQNFSIPALDRRSWSACCTVLFATRAYSPVTHWIAFLWGPNLFLLRERSSLKCDTNSFFTDEHVR